jgi:hypothetical protein
MRNILTMVLALVAGFIGGTLASGNGAAASAPGVVRASKFELMNAAGAHVATWDVDAYGTAHLCFMNRGGVRLDLGVGPTGLPFLKMAGADGEERLALVLSEFDKPLLAMGDEKWHGRVVLGFRAPDTKPYGDSDVWGLFFRGVGSEQPRAAIGVSKAKGDNYDGFLGISGERIR